MGEVVERSNELSALMTDYGTRRVTRRGFIQRAAALGLSVPAAAALMASAGPQIAFAQDTPKQGGEFIEGYDRDFTKMDTVNSGWADPGYNLIYEYTMLRDADGAIVPAMAESWTIAEDNLTWTLKIRDGLKFHSGAPCTNAEVAANFNAFRSAEAGGQNAIFWASVTDVNAGEGNTVVVSLSSHSRPSRRHSPPSTP